MKLAIAVLLLLLSSGLAMAAAASQARLVEVRATHAPVQRHKAHKVTKHKAPKRHRHAV
jgi:hypothetical protein